MLIGTTKQSPDHPEPVEGSPQPAQIILSLRVLPQKDMAISHPTFYYSPSTSNLLDSNIINWELCILILEFVSDFAFRI